MKLFKFSALQVFQGNTYAELQVVAFQDDIDTAQFSGDVVESAPVFIEHIDHSLPQE